MDLTAFDVLHPQVFGPASEQAEVFAKVAELVQSALDGYQVTSEQFCLSGNKLLGWPPALFLLARGHCTDGRLRLSVRKG